jgi:uncharacterized protein (DUF4415 family)
MSDKPKDTDNKDQNLSKNKVRINTWIDADVINELKRMAEDSGEKYQTLLNRFLRIAVLGELTEADKRIVQLSKTRGIN